jgi:hypothetical protein
LAAWAGKDAAIASIAGTDDGVLLNERIDNGENGAAWCCLRLIPAIIWRHGPVFEQFRHLGDDLCLMLSARDIGSPGNQARVWL